MPISKYNDLFGVNAQKTLDSLIKEYGKEKGTQIFYAMVNKRKGTMKKAIKGRLK